MRDIDCRDDLNKTWNPRTHRKDAEKEMAVRDIKASDGSQIALHG